MDNLSSIWLLVGLSLPVIAALISIFLGRLYARRDRHSPGPQLVRAGLGQLAAGTAGLLGVLVAYLLGGGRQPTIQLLTYAYAYPAASVTFIVALFAYRLNSTSLSDVARGGAVVSLAAALAMILATLVTGVPFFSPTGLYR
jgi:hypothetical protein